MPKSTIELINSNKNKLNSKIILIFHSYPNEHLGSVCFVSSNSLFYILNTLTHISIHFFTHKYIKNAQNILLKLSYQTNPLFFFVSIFLASKKTSVGPAVMNFHSHSHIRPCNLSMKSLK